MRIEIINICNDFKTGKVTSHKAMDIIIDILFPKKIVADYNNYVAKLISFMWDIKEDELINLEPERGGDLTTFKAKVMYTKIISYNRKESGKFITKLEIGRIVGIKDHSGVSYRLNQHDRFYTQDKEYKYIYDIIKKVLI